MKNRNFKKAPTAPTAPLNRSNAMLNDMSKTRLRKWDIRAQRWLRLRRSTYLEACEKIEILVKKRGSGNCAKFLGHTKIKDNIFQKT